MPIQAEQPQMPQPSQQGSLRNPVSEEKQQPELPRRRKAGATNSQSHIQNAGEGIETLTTANTDTVQLIRGLFILDGREHRERIKGGTYIPIIKEVQQHFLSLE